MVERRTVAPVVVGSNPIGSASIVNYNIYWRYFLDRIRINKKEEKLIKKISKNGNNNNKKAINNFLNFLKAKDVEKRIPKTFLETKIEYWENKVNQNN